MPISGSGDSTGASEPPAHGIPTAATDNLIINKYLFNNWRLTSAIILHTQRYRILTVIIIQAPPTCGITYCTETNAMTYIWTCNIWREGRWRGGGRDVAIRFDISIYTNTGSRSWTVFNNSLNFWWRDFFMDRIPFIMIDLHSGKVWYVIVWEFNSLFSPRMEHSGQPPMLVTKCKNITEWMNEWMKDSLKTVLTYL